MNLGLDAVRETLSGTDSLLDDVAFTRVTPQSALQLVFGRDCFNQVNMHFS